MSLISLGYINCPDLQVPLDQTFNNRGTRTENTPLVNTLLSSPNRSGLEQIINPGGGKSWTVENIYSPRYNMDEISTTITRDCASTNDAGETSFTCTVDEDVGVSVNQRFVITDMIRRCKSNQAWFIEQIQAMINGGDRKMEESVADQLALLTGGFSAEDTDGVAADIKTVQTLSGTGLVFDAISEIRFSAMAAAFAGPTYVFGSNAISKYFTATEAGCCLDDGVDINEFKGQSGIVFQHSREIANALDATTDFLVYDLGSAQIAGFNLYDGPFNAAQNGIESFGTVVSRATGVRYDISITRDCNTYVVQITKPFTVCALPDDLYSIPDHLNGVNGLLQFRVTNS